ncbi:MAG: acyl-ACP desaturase [Cytophagaceae bacterium]|nr:acyl-ACP desaturase [Cytophagaceae bacterium]MBP6094369.1 acyl-ACP desaturase [Cytophagaceae bacterium]
MSQFHTRLEVMSELAKNMDSYMKDFLNPIDSNWQPADMLPDSTKENFFDEVKLLQEAANELPYDYWAVLIGDTITEEALPTYESWLLGMETVDHLDQENGWVKWIRSWTAEENRHGNLLGTYLYLSGKVDMRAVAISTQYLIADGFDIGTSADPYRNFVYTSFQEWATNISHRRTASLAKQHGNSNLSRMCAQIAADELRHAKAYKAFVAEIFKLDPSEMMLAFADMMKKKIVMPAHFLREMSGAKSSLFDHFSDAAQRIGVYTTADYTTIMRGLIQDWDLESVRGLNDQAEKARDYVIGLPARLERLAERVKVPELAYPFSWIV